MKLVVAGLVLVVVLVLFNLPQLGQLQVRAAAPRSGTAPQVPRQVGSGAPGPNLQP